MAQELLNHDLDMVKMDRVLVTMGYGLVGHGPMVMIGRVDPSTNFSYAVDRQLFHDVPADTSETGFLLRLGLQPYAFSAKFFGIFKRGDHTLLPTEPTLYHSEAAPGIDVHGRLFASKVLYQFGLTTDAAPEFLDRIHTAAPARKRLHHGAAGPGRVARGHRVEPPSRPVGRLRRLHVRPGLRRPRAARRALRAPGAGPDGRARLPPDAQPPTVGALRLDERGWVQERRALRAGAASVAGAAPPDAVVSLRGRQPGQGADPRPPRALAPRQREPDTGRT